jgi:hypothetical protein
MQASDQLFEACKSGHIDQLAQCLATLSKLLNQDALQWLLTKNNKFGPLTLLTLAAGEGHATICQMLLDKGVDVNQRSEGMVVDLGIITVGITP